jgi:hypothetical protein
MSESIAKAEMERARELALLEFLEQVQSDPNHKKLNLHSLKPKPAMSDDDQPMFDEYASFLDTSLMTHDDLAKSFEKYSYKKLPLDVKRTVTRGMRRAEVSRLKSLMPVLRLPHRHRQRQWSSPSLATVEE